MVDLWRSVSCSIARLSLRDCVLILPITYSAQPREASKMMVSRRISQVSKCKSYPFPVELSNWVRKAYSMDGVDYRRWRNGPVLIRRRAVFISILFIFGVVPFWILSYNQTNLSSDLYHTLSESGLNETTKITKISVGNRANAVFSVNS